MSRIFWASALGAALAFGAQAGEPKQVVLDVPSMNCALCPLSVKKALKKVPGVLAAKADLATKTAQVSYDPDHVSAERLAKAVSDSGYPAAVRRP